MGLVGDRIVALARRRGPAGAGRRRRAAGRSPAARQERAAGSQVRRARCTVSRVSCTTSSTLVGRQALAPGGGGDHRHARLQQDAVGGGVAVLRRPHARGETLLGVHPLDPLGGSPEPRHSRIAAVLARGFPARRISARAGRGPGPGPAGGAQGRLPGREAGRRTGGRVIAGIPVTRRALRPSSSPGPPRLHGLPAEGRQDLAPAGLGAEAQERRPAGSADRR